MNSICRLFIDYLVPETGDRWRFEENGDLLQNPAKNAFQSLHHLFCNITEVPLDVLVGIKGGQFHVGTQMYPPNASPGGWDQKHTFPVRY